MLNRRTYLPEWADQGAVLLAWPHERTDWEGILPEIDATYAELVRRISWQQPVIIITPDHRVIGKILPDSLGENIQLVRMDTNDTWIRDYGPVTALDASGFLLNNYHFNAWGGKFPYELDDHVTEKLFVQEGLFPPNVRLASHDDFILEGGSIDTNGNGLLLTTERCLLAANRNPGLSRETIEQKLKSDLGINRVIWLRHGYLTGDDTDGHIDTLARFCDEHSIAYVRCTDPSDPDYPELDRMERQLREVVKSLKGMRLVPLPMPEPVVDEQGKRLPATYANFLIINGAVLVPTYNCQHDAEAIDTIGALFPGRAVIGIDARVLIKQGGSIHCATMQLPKGSILWKRNTK